MPPMTGPAGAFAGALFATGYQFPLLAATQLGTGVLLLSNRFVPLALALLAPVLVHIVTFHAFLAPQGMGLPLALLAAEIYLAFAYREAFAPMLRERTQPAPSKPRGARTTLSAAA
jgi:hypothetical protein